jgi:hypothetical protein
LDNTRPEAARFVPLAGHNPRAREMAGSLAYAPGTIPNPAGSCLLRCRLAIALAEEFTWSSVTNVIFGLVVSLLTVRGIVGLVAAVRDAAWLEGTARRAPRFSTSRCDISRSVVNLRTFLETRAMPQAASRCGLGCRNIAPSKLLAVTKAIPDAAPPSAGWSTATPGRCAARHDRSSGGGWAGARPPAS